MSSTIVTFPAPELGLAARALRVARRVGAFAAGMVRAARHRREVAELLELDARSLRDIGLQPSDVRGALAGPLSEDPSIWLTQRSFDRRAALRSLSDDASRAAKADRRF